MQILVETLTAEFELTEQRTRAALGVLLKLIEQHAEPRDFADLVDGLSGAEQLLTEAQQGAASRRRLFRASGGLVGSLAGAISSRSSLMAAAAELQKQGVGLKQLRPFITAFAAHAEAEVGQDLVERVASTIPGLADLRA